MRPVLPLLLPLLLANGDPFAQGVDAYREGRYREAYEAFTEAEIAAADAADPELLFNRALAALRVGELRAAEIAAETAAARGGREFARLADFILGGAAFSRCELAAAEADLKDADPTSLARAIMHGETARGFWELAAASRGDWPEARRNLERALNKLDELRRKIEEAESQARKTEPEPEERPETDEPREEVEEDPTLQQEEPELTPEQLASLFDKLAQVESQKRTLRETMQRIRSAGVEKDW